MPKFRKKPVVIEACRFEGWADNKTDAPRNVWPSGWDVSAWRRDRTAAGTLDQNPLVIPTLEGDMFARAGDWIIRGVRGEFYPCKSDIFAATYEEVAP